MRGKRWGGGRRLSSPPPGRGEPGLRGMRTMVINRLQAYFGEPPEERPPAGEFYIVAGGAGCFFVSRETAQDIVRQLGRRRPPRFITFRDLAGSEVRLRPGKIDMVYESTGEQRARDREFNRTLREEGEEDRPAWED